MKRKGVNRLIFSSSAAVYGEPGEIPISEKHSLQPSSPYGPTKMAVERMLADCEAAFDLRYISLRYFNAAGADPSGLVWERHDPETHLIPLVLKVAAGKRDTSLKSSRPEGQVESARGGLDGRAKRGRLR